MKDYSPVYTLWSKSEKELAEPLTGVASSIDSCYKATEGLTTGLSEDMLPTLHEYVLCAETLKVSFFNDLRNLLGNLWLR